MTTSSKTDYTNKMIAITMTRLLMLILAVMLIGVTSVVGTSNGEMDSLYEKEGCTSLGSRFPLYDDAPAADMTPVFIAGGSNNTTGSYGLWNDFPLYADSVNGTVIASGYGNCILLPEGSQFYCYEVFVFDDNTDDSITFAGAVVHARNVTSYLAISGGTGCYDGNSGTIAVIENDGVFNWNVTSSTFKTSSSNDKSIDINDDSTTCLPLKDRFNGGPIFEEDTKDDTLPTSDQLQVGTVSIWANETLRMGSIDGEPIGSSYGICTLLPKGKEQYCMGTLVFDDTGDSITYAGGVANDYNKRGTILITGGTGW